MSKSTFALIAIAIAVASCQDSIAPVPHRGIKIVAGTTITDSALAVLTEFLRVEVRDSSGALATSGTAVIFSGTVEPSTFPEALIQSPTTGSYLTFLNVPTNVSGQVGVKVRLGSRAGAARISISVPTLGLADTARFTIVPGAAAAMTIAPSDTALYVDRSYTLRGGVTDAYGNVRTDPVVWTVSASGVTVSSDRVASASAIGRYTMTGTAGALTRSASVSVVPQGRLASFQGGSIVSVDLSGANMKLLTGFSDGGIGPHPAWMPGSDKIIYTHYNGSLQLLRTVDETGVFAQFFATPPSTMTHQAEPTPAFNGQYLYFSAWDSQCAPESYCLYRSKLDASEPEVLGTFLPPLETRSPAPSPDGSKVAYTSNSNDGTTMRVFDVATKTASTWGVAGNTPAWSPDGAQLAFVAPTGPIKLINSDGSGERFLTAVNSSYLGRPMSWSPDGKWIVARGGGLLNVIDATTGAVLPLPYSSQLLSASWK